MVVPEFSSVAENQDWEMVDAVVETGMSGSLWEVEVEGERESRGVSRTITWETSTDPEGATPEVERYGYELAGS